MCCARSLREKASKYIWPATPLKGRRAGDVGIHGVPNMNTATTEKAATRKVGGLRKFDAIVAARLGYGGPLAVCHGGLRARNPNPSFCLSNGMPATERWPLRAPARCTDIAEALIQ
jgi:hypothetical protein